MNASNVKEITFHSNMLDKEMRMLVYLPESYDNLTSLPVLYFLHGRSGNETIMHELEIRTLANQMIKDQRIKPMLIVCPNIENSRGINSSTRCKQVADLDNRMIQLGMYEDYLIEEIVPFIDTHFKTIKDRTGRFIGGVSGGGYAALHNAFRHQDMFSKVGGHMPALELTLEVEDKPYFSTMGLWEKYNPLYIAKNNEMNQDMEVYLDAGNEDEGGFYQGCSVFDTILKEKGIPCQNYVFEGHHNTEYIKSNLEKYLSFYGS